VERYERYSHVMAESPEDMYWGQGQIYHSAGRVTTFMPSFRMTMDMATTEMHSNLAGGPRDRRFPKWYSSGLQDWFEGKYKQTRPEEDQPKLNF